MHMNTMDRIYKTGVVPVVVLKDANDALAAADALSSGGIDTLEITLRTDAALESIRIVANERPDLLLGAGTVVTLTQCKQALKAGARFIVSPGFDKEVAAYCIDNQIPVFPGCVTPSEIMAGLKLGLKIFKFFPAGIYGGLKAMHALAGPFGDVRFIPTGGINGENMQAYIETPFIHAVGGSWMCAAKDISEHAWGKIAALSQQAVGIVKQFRK